MQLGEGLTDFGYPRRRPAGMPGPATTPRIIKMAYCIFAFAEEGRWMRVFFDFRSTNARKTARSSPTRAFYLVETKMPARFHVYSSCLHRCVRCPIRLHIDALNVDIPVLGAVLIRRHRLPPFLHGPVKYSLVVFPAEVQRLLVLSDRADPKSHGSQLSRLGFLRQFGSATYCDPAAMFVRPKSWSSSK